MAIDGPVLPMLAPHVRFQANEVRETTAPDETGASAFDALVKNLASSANQTINQAQEAGAAFAAGQRDDIHGTMLSLSKADIELRVLGNVRNRVIDAFYEIWRMQI
ncbi:MAG: flagellar hook-basal body complex protein FliE [Polyangiaceae bacterium]